jgi:hypothetical protein
MNVQNRTINFKPFVQQNMSPSMKVDVHWVNLMKSLIIEKFQNLIFLQENVAKQRTHFLNHLAKQLCSMGSK